MKQYDVMILGTGTAGQTAAYDLAAEGLSVAIVERSSRPGGICALAGCQAKKWFYELTETVARCRHLDGLGVTAPPAISWHQVLQAKNRFTEAIPASTVKNLQGNGIDVIEGDARFVDAATVRIEDDVYRPRYTIIATGAEPRTLPMPGADQVKRSSEFLDLETLPERIVFIGGGFISFEFAHFAARLGTPSQQIHIVEANERPLSSFDATMVELLGAATGEEGINLHTGSGVAEIKSESDRLSVHLESGRTLTADLVVHGAGRVPAIEGLNLEAAAIDFDSHGISVDASMTTSNPRVYAIGDCAATIQLARVADQEAHTAAAAVVAREHGGEAPVMDYRPVPAVLFTYPQLGKVGATEEELQQQQIRYWKSSDSKVGWPTYRRVGMQHAAYKVLVDEAGKVLGAHLLGDNVTGLLNTFKQAMIDGKTVHELHRDNIMSPYPSRESDMIYMLNPLLD